MAPVRASAGSSDSTCGIEPEVQGVRVLQTCDSKAARQGSQAHLQNASVASFLGTRPIFFVKLVAGLPAILEDQDGLYDGYEAGINATTCPRYKSGAAWIPTITDSSRYAPEGRNATSPTNVGSLHTDIFCPGYR